ncbi:FAD/NAD(P)-binding protein [Myxococcus sp. K15C18031901]|uniref:FAD/NAD(P)-binding protein n=1 Tax=Myxococcus dinghuensis TaxID=2906761 RepID=UPI0020A7E9A6|nr:FAD/NAD(P)-binding protein [Myxococcus dinghuensis]MCP3102428.1 FAD/NAD(P)-binding protein [Myxococcus dinghuensis]
MSGPHVVIVGGGPFCTYALERLAALLPALDLSSGLTLSIFERTGHFGAGATHSDAQVPTSYMNRVASQIGFAADESSADAPRLLPRELRPTFTEWADAKYQATGDRRFLFHPVEVPPRYLHGEALRERFDGYVAWLRELPNVTVDLHAAEVTDIAREDSGGFRVHAGDVSLHATHVLLVTGHSNNHPAPGSLEETLAAHAHQTPPARHVPFAYPLDAQVSEETVPPGSTVGVLGMGLTAIDVLLHLTEGRGGTFVREPSLGAAPVLRYLPSGREPAAIVAVSPSGMFTTCRPYNAKAVDGSGRGHGALQHTGVFLTSAAVDTLRENVGQRCRVQGTEVRQLDFERHVFPLVVLEMAYVYSTTLLGAHLGPTLRGAAEARYREFLREGCLHRDDGIEALLAPLQACLDGLGEARPAQRFDWRAWFHPLGEPTSIPGDVWREQLIAFMRRDHEAAAKGNLRDPTKAACDGVWRDLRAIYSQVVDFGGLTAASHRRFVEVYWRYYIRMSNGAGLEAMSKVLALVEAGRVDVSIGPRPIVEPLPGRPSFRIRGPVTGTRRDVGVLVEGKAHPFDAERDMGPLYPNLLRRGLVRRWRNPGAVASEDFIPGGLDVSTAFHPLQADGRPEPRLTILGASIEGVAFFQLSAARPQSNSSILNTIARWANELVEDLSSALVVERDVHVPPR